VVGIEGGASEAREHYIDRSAVLYRYRLGRRVIFTCFGEIPSLSDREAHRRRAAPKLGRDFARI
jgi:hypothetical protein